MSSLLAGVIGSQDGPFATRMTVWAAQPKYITDGKTALPMEITTLPTGKRCFRRKQRYHRQKNDATNGKNDVSDRTNYATDGYFFSKRKQ